MNSRIIDISPLVSERIGVFPGDVSFSRQSSLQLERGDNIDLSSVHTTLHLGAHADAPSHYARDGAGIDARPLDLYYGPCQVVRVMVERGARILPRDLGEPIAVPRVLFRTDSFLDPDRFDEEFASLSPALVDDLHTRGVRLVGIDTPSIDPCRDPVLESHQAIARHDMANLEGLVLQHVESGLYTLVALPLKIEGADASPVRAILLEATSAFPG